MSGCGASLNPLSDAAQGPLLGPGACYDRLLRARGALIVAPGRAEPDYVDRWQRVRRMRLAFCRRLPGAAALILVGDQGAPPAPVGR